MQVRKKNFRNERDAFGDDDQSRDQVISRQGINFPDEDINGKETIRSVETKKEKAPTPTKK